MSFKRKNGSLNINLLDNNNSKKNKTNQSTRSNNQSTRSNSNQNYISNKSMVFKNDSKNGNRNNSSTGFGESYCFDDILMEPLLSNVKSRRDINLEVDLGNNGRHLYLKNPLISSPMDTVTEDQMAIKMSLKGGLGIIHRFMTIEEQVSQVKKVKRYLQYIIKNPYLIDESESLLDLKSKIESTGVSTYCVVSGLNTTEDIFNESTANNISNMSFRITRSISNSLSNESHKQYNNQYKLLGIITKRDISFFNEFQPQNLNVKVKDLMTPLKNIHSITYNGNKFKSLFKNGNYKSRNFKKMIENAKNLMMRHKIEKIPILDENQYILGLITWKNINHYENNQNSASLDEYGRLLVGAAIGIREDIQDNYKERLNKLMEEDVDLINVDVASGFNYHVIGVIQWIRKTYPNLVIMAGSVCESNGFIALGKAGADCIRVGIGNGSICSTRLETGVGKGQFSAITECFDAAFYFGKNNLYHDMPKIICDGGSLGKTGNKMKALAAGCSGIIMGKTLAATEESPGNVIFRNGRRMKYYRGMASTMANLNKQEKLNGKGNINTKFTAEGVDTEIEMKGSVVDIIDQILGGIKSGMSYLGCHTVPELFQKNIDGVIKSNLVTPIGMSESGIRVKKN